MVDYTGHGDVEAGENCAPAGQVSVLQKTALKNTAPKLPGGLTKLRRVPVRQWVLSVPYALRSLLTREPAVLTAVLVIA